MFKTIIIFHFDIYYMQFIFVWSLVMCYSFMVVNILHNHHTGAQDRDSIQPIVGGRVMRVCSGVVVMW